jgi:hypothetical protein
MPKRDAGAVMIRGVRSGVVAAMALVLSMALPSTALAQSGGAPPDPKPTGIEGVVVDSAGTPLRGARLIVRDTARIGAAALRRQSGESDSTGKFRIIGLPAGAHVLEVQRDEFEPAGFQFNIGTGIMAQVRIKLQRDPLWAEMKRAADSILAVERADSIAAAAAAARAPLARPGAAATTIQGGKGMLYGRVLNPEGLAIGFAQVQAMGTPITTVTDSSGRFRLPDLNVGPYFLRARKVGYDPVVFSAQVIRGDSLDATITLTPFTSARGTRLDTVRVTADADRMSRRLRGFEERRRTARGLYVDRAEITLRRPQQFSDLLRGRANITVQRNGANGETQVFGPRLSISSGYCPLALIVDGVLIPNVAGSIDALVPVEMIAGIEVYNSGTSVPGEFARLGTDCGAIVVWTR